MIFRKDPLTVFTDDLNNVDYTRCITFVYEEESTGVIPFMNLLSKCQPGGSVLVQVYWKATHAELCLLLGSHDAISHKTGVVRTVMVLTERRRRTTHFDRLCYTLWLYTVDLWQDETWSGVYRKQDQKDCEKDYIGPWRLVVITYVEGLSRGYWKNLP